MPKIEINELVLKTMMGYVNLYNEEVQRVVNVLDYWVREVRS